MMYLPFLPKRSYAWRARLADSSVPQINVY